MKKQTLAPFEAAVFDMDGTLLYSMHIWEQLIQDFLVEQKVRPSEGLREALRPLNMEDTAVYLKQEYGMAETPAQIIDGINALALRKYEQEASCKEGVAEYLAQLQAKGVRMVAATATDRVVAQPILEKLGLAPYFDALLTCTDEGLDKNTPEIYLRAMAAAGVSDPARCAVFEDALHCIRTVRAAGFYTVAVRDFSAAYAWDEICATADAHIDNYLELLEG